MQAQTARYFIYWHKLGTQRHLFSIRAEEMGPNPARLPALADAVASHDHGA